MLDEQPRMYTDFAGWWPLLSPPAHYIEEAADLRPTLLAATDQLPRTLLELGCGGGSVISGRSGSGKKRSPKSDLFSKRPGPWIARRDRILRLTGAGPS